MIVRPAPYLPFLDAHRGRPPGLWALPETDWIEIDAAYAAQMAYRDRLIREQGAAVADSAPEGQAAVRELVAMLRRHLLDHPSAGFQDTGDGVRRPDGFVLRAPGDEEDAMAWVAHLGRYVQEDLCLLRRGPDESEHRLVAAALCFPSHWRLREKIGRPLLEIHGPVPHYAQDLAARVERVHAALHVDRPLQRLNYGVHDTPELHLPHGHDDDCDDQHKTDASAPEARFYLRVERQTLRRLPETRAVVFGIKTYVTPIDDLDRPDRAALIERINALTPAQLAYKGGAGKMAAAKAALRA